MLNISIMNINASIRTTQNNNKCKQFKPKFENYS
jgi:hypothetical protein